MLVHASICAVISEAREVPKRPSCRYGAMQFSVLSRLFLDMPVEVKSFKVRSRCFGAAAVVTGDQCMNEALLRRLVSALRQQWTLQHLHSVGACLKQTDAGASKRVHAL